MKLADVLFIGGRWPKFASVQIRCVDIATRLGCAYCVNVKSLEQIPTRFQAFICVKARLKPGDLTLLAKRGPVVWDTIDNGPTSPESIAHYVVSTETARRATDRARPVSVIRHHHCNFDRTVNDPTLRRPAWIGNLQWYPQMPRIDHDMFNVLGRTQAEIASAYRGAGIGLNLRARAEGYERHALLNSGIKLINCIGFGIPSVSEPEPSYLELGQGCTLFTDLAGSAAAVEHLKRDDRDYLELSARCRDRAEYFHLDTVAAEYRKLIAAL
jgi:hypothetical protein